MMEQHPAKWLRWEKDEKDGFWKQNTKLTLDS